MSRNTLHLSHLEPFKQYLRDNSIAFRPGLGDYQVLQVQLRNGQWACIYSRGKMPEHFTADKRLDPLIAKFIEQRKAVRE